jgi:hypothetical protein
MHKDVHYSINYHTKNTNNLNVYQWKCSGIEKRAWKREDKEKAMGQEKREWTRTMLGFEYEMPTLPCSCVNPLVPS